MQDLFKHRQLLKRIGNGIKLSPLKEVFNVKTTRTVVFRTYLIKEKAIAIVSKDEVEKVLGVLVYKT